MVVRKPSDVGKRFEGLLSWRFLVITDKPACLTREMVQYDAGERHGSGITFETRSGNIEEIPAYVRYYGEGFSFSHYRRTSPYRDISILTGFPVRKQITTDITVEAEEAPLNPGIRFTGDKVQKGRIRTWGAMLRTRRGTEAAVSYGEH